MISKTPSAKSAANAAQRENQSCPSLCAFILKTHLVIPSLFYGLELLEFVRLIFQTQDPGVQF